MSANSEPTSPAPAIAISKGLVMVHASLLNQVLQYFHKAIVLNPDFSRAYFSQGVSYGQLGQYQKAVAQINMALQKEPQNGLYHYGRGRVYLLWGDRQKAMTDFRKAADLGNEDAIDYLEYIGEDKL